MKTPIPDKEWNRYVKWWKSQWPFSSPHRSSVELYLKWKQEKK